MAGPLTAAISTPARILEAAFKVLQQRKDSMQLDIGCGHLGVANFLPPVTVSESTSIRLLSQH